MLNQQVVEQFAVVFRCEEANVAVEEPGCALVENNFPQAAHRHVFTVEGMLGAEMDLE